MAEFLVKMADEQGRVLEQTESGFSEKEIRERYAQQGYLVYSVKGQGGLLSLNLIGGGPKIKRDEFIIFNQQFVTLIKAGLPILMGINLLSKRQRNPYFKGILENVKERLKSGQLLSEAFEAQGQKVVSKVYTTTLLAGEKSGNLEEVLSRYIEYQRITASFRKKLLASLWYPAVLVVALVVMLSFLITYVVPQFAALYATFNATLPVLTQVLLRVGTTLQKYFYFVIPGMAATVIAAVVWFRSERGAEAFDAVRFKLPVAGEIWMKYQVALFCRTLATLLAGGMPLVSSLETASSSINSAKIVRNVAHAAQRVREGQSLAGSIEETGFFPELAVEMIEVGESTGALATMLNSVAEFYEEDVQNALTAAMQLIEPAILIFMGAVVAVVLMALYLPIFSLGEQIQH